MPGEDDEILWLFGQGLSIDCGLTWDERIHCPQLTREEKIRCIREQLRAAMDAPGVNRKPIHDFLQFLSERTEDRWKHRFLTTNWDFLLQDELNKFAADVPRWMRDTHVIHLNGTVEVRKDNSNRSAIMLREDRERTPSLELNIARSTMEWGSTFVVVGMSFECEQDKALFAVLNEVQARRLRPSGYSDWIIVNPHQAALDSARDLIRRKLPEANVEVVCDTLTRWREAQFPRLNEKGVFS